MGLEYKSASVSGRQKITSTKRMANASHLQRFLATRQFIHLYFNTLVVRLQWTNVSQDTPQSFIIRKLETVWTSARGTSGTKSSTAWCWNVWQYASLMQSKPTMLLHPKSRHLKKTDSHWAMLNPVLVQSWYFYLLYWTVTFVSKLICFGWNKDFPDCVCWNRLCMQSWKYLDWRSCGAQHHYCQNLKKRKLRYVTEPSLQARLICGLCITHKNLS